MSKWLSSKSLEITNADTCRGKGALVQGRWYCKLVQSQWKTVRKFLKKLIKLPCHTGFHFWAYNWIKWKDTCIPIFIAALFTIVKIWKQSKCPSTDDWLKDVDYMQLNISHKSNKILPFAATWLDLESIMLSEISQTKKNMLHYHLI